MIEKHTLERGEAHFLLQTHGQTDRGSYRGGAHGKLVCTPLKTNTLLNAVFKTM